MLLSPNAGKQYCASNETYGVVSVPMSYTVNKSSNNTQTQLGSEVLIVFMPSKCNVHYRELGFGNFGQLSAQRSSIGLKTFLGNPKKEVARSVALYFWLTYWCCHTKTKHVSFESRRPDFERETAQKSKTQAPTIKLTARRLLWTKIQACGPPRSVGSNDAATIASLLMSCKVIPSDLMFSKSFRACLSSILSSQSSESE